MDFISKLCKKRFRNRLKKMNIVLQYLVILLTNISALLFIWGLYNCLIEIDDNDCEMTYMFESPQYTEVKLANNKHFPIYKLYRYYEGRRNAVPDLNGAPVLFVPGNAGSYKQVRSLASVALRMSINSRSWMHMDYFSIDYNEELCGLFGGYLEIQSAFLKHCIRTIFKQYTQRPDFNRTVVIIAHSMGGVVVKNILRDTEMVKSINSIVYISSPLDRPVVNIDMIMNDFYERSNTILKSKVSQIINKTIISSHSILSERTNFNISNYNTGLNNILSISIGGGRRDKLVPAALTKSQSSDIHVMTSAIPDVWASCDHMSALWCLQLMKVINKFLHSILKLKNFKSKNNHELFTYFNDDFSTRYQLAYKYFVRNSTYSSNTMLIDMPKDDIDSFVHESFKKNFHRNFQFGLKKKFKYIIPLTNFSRYENIYIEVNNAELNMNWLYGCFEDKNPNGKSLCKESYSLAHYIYRMPSKKWKKSFAMLNLHDISKNHMAFSHLQIRLHPTTYEVSFYIDIFNSEERIVHLKSSFLLDITDKVLIPKTDYGNIFYQLQIEGLREVIESINLYVREDKCLINIYETSAKLNIPWAMDSNIFYTKTQEKKHKNFYVNIPENIPIGFNISEKPIFVNLHLDPNCQHQISYHASIADTMRQIVQNFYYILPGHITLLFFIAIVNSIRCYQKRAIFKPCTEFFQCKSFFIVLICSFLKKFVFNDQHFAKIDVTSPPMFAVLILHGVAIIVCSLLSLILWTLLFIFGVIVNCVTRRTPGFQINAINETINTTILSSAFAILLIAIAVASCSGISLTLTLVIFTLLLSSKYVDYIKNMKEFNNQVEIKEGTSNESNLYYIYIYRVSLLRLIAVLGLFSIPQILAWFRDYMFIRKQPFSDISFLTNAFAICSFIFIWKLQIPKRLHGSKICLPLLYLSAITCILYCEEKIFRLNFVVAINFVSMLVIQLFEMR